MGDESPSLTVGIEIFCATDFCKFVFRGSFCLLMMTSTVHVRPPPPPPDREHLTPLCTYADCPNFELKRLKLNSILTVEQ